MVGKNNAYKMLVGKSRGRIIFWGCRYSREGNIKTDLRETNCEGMKCTEVAQDRVHCLAYANMVMNLQDQKRERTLPNQINNCLLLCCSRYHTQ
jgi:hypothetical protein